MQIPDGYFPYNKSLIMDLGSRYLLVKQIKTGNKKLLVQGDTRGFTGDRVGEAAVALCDLNHDNAAELRRRLEWLAPQPAGITTSFGFGDRLGLATPGHIHSIGEKNIYPVFAQQSVRENTRTGRTPQDVVDEAMWGVFQEGWRRPWGADADHIKVIEVIESFIDSGYTMFTIDPGDYVAPHVDEYTVDEVRNKAENLPWGKLGWNCHDFLRKWVGKEVGGLGIVYDENIVTRGIVKYGEAIAHTKSMFDVIHQLRNGAPFDFEVSVDETESPTSIEEHFMIACELRRLGVRWTSLAPRFLGRFEKGVDFIGDLDQLESSIKKHADVARLIGGYKLSLHSGSDKFSVYPIIRKHTSGLLHVKTAGTSYLEALRVIAECEPVLFGDILTFALNRYEIDKATYHVSGELARIPIEIKNSADLLDQFDARQVFHVTYGSVLDKFGSLFYKVIKNNEDLYYNVLAKHFRHHLDLLIDLLK